MSFFKKVTAKPWLGDPEAFDVAPGGGAATVRTKRIGLFIFIGVATALFSLFAVAYHMRMMMGGWHILEEPLILWPNTLILLGGSMLMQWSSRAAKRGDMELAKRTFFWGGMAGVVFLVGQLAAWKELIDLGCYADVNPANAFFYLITGLHGVHLIGGQYAWGRAMLKTVGGAKPEDIATSIELCDYYWHFMLWVWMGLFLLLMST